MFFQSLLSFAKLGPSKGRGPLTTKRAPSLKKGYGSIGLGRHTNKGFFLIDTRLVPQFHAPPDLSTCQLKPYVSKRTHRIAWKLLSLFTRMSDTLLEEVRRACKPGKLSGVSEAKAPAVVAEELERLKKVQRLADVLKKMEKEFPGRESQIQERAKNLTKEILAENAENKKRDEKIIILNRRQDELKMKSGALMEILKSRATNFQIGRFQSEELWNLILRMADLVTGLNKTRPEISMSLENRVMQSEAEVLEVLVRNNSERIVKTESQLRELMLDVEEIEERSKNS